MHGSLVETSTQQTWLWIGAIGMALGAVAIFGLGGRGHGQHHRITSVFVCAIAACMYLLMALGQGVAIFSETTVALTRDGLDVTSAFNLVYWARYLDWIITTPLLLIGLLTVALRANSGGEAGRDRQALVGAVIGADVLMIVTGFIGTISFVPAHKYVWFGVSCGFFLAVVAALWGPVRAAAAEQGAEVAGLYSRLAGILTVLWFIYPILWLLGTEGTNTIGRDAEVITFAIIDLTAKAVFGILLVTGVQKLSAHAHAKV
ncbi:MAG: bacteriorhodopsin [Mycobacterium sp.]